MNEYIESCQREKRTYDEEGVREAVRLFLKSIGEDPEREGLVETPDRIARACRELFAGLQASPADVLESCFRRGRPIEAGAGQGHRTVFGVRASPAAFPWRGPCGLHSAKDGVWG